MSDHPSFALNLPTKVHCGVGALAKVPDLVAALGKRVIAVVPAELSDAGRQLEEILRGRGLEVRMFPLASSEPTCSFIDVSAAQLRSRPTDCLVALGGGSAIDTAKALAIALTNPEPIWEYANLSYRPPKPLAHDPLPVVAVPTTSGTGAEVTPYAVLTNDELRQKGTIQEPKLFPVAAVLDPMLTRSLPPALTASTGIDAFAHALESYLNVSKHSPVTEWAAKEAMAIIVGTLPATFRNPADLELRAKMCWASTLAGIAISHRGTTTAHAIAEPLGALTHLPHGVAVALCTIPVLRRTLPAIERQAATLHRALRVASGTTAAPRDEARAFLSDVEALVESVGLHKPASHFLPKEKLEGLDSLLCESILKFKFRPLKQHPVEFGAEELLEVIRAVLHG